MHQDYQITACVQEITATFIQKKLLNENSYSQSNHETVVPISGKAQKRPQYQFPISAEEIDSMICEHERVIKIYNKQNNATRKKLNVTMENWFLDEAKRCGWTSAKFFKCDGSTRKACLLMKNTELENGYVSKH